MILPVPNNGKVGNQALCPHSRCFGSHFDVIFLMYLVCSDFSFKPTPFSSIILIVTQFSQGVSVKENTFFHKSSWDTSVQETPVFRGHLSLEDNIRGQLSSWYTYPEWTPSLGDVSLQGDTFLKQITVIKVTSLRWHLCSLAISRMGHINTWTLLKQFAFCIICPYNIRISTK